MLIDLFAPVRTESERSGGFFRDMTHHVAAYLPASGRRLVVTFDNLAARRESDSRYPWAHTFLAPKGFDVLGIMSKRYDWFRHADVWDLFDDLRDTGFFRRFDHVAFYGASMGGYGALAFGCSAPGCTVLAFAPQTTLNLEIAPFETRYRYGRSLGDWTGRYVDGAKISDTAGRVYIGYDPLEPIDRLHAARVTGPRVIRLLMPNAGHKVPPALQKMGILKPVVERALTGELDVTGFSTLFRARRTSIPWIVSLLERAAERGHHALALGAAEQTMSERPHWKIRQLIKDLRAAQAQTTLSIGSDRT